MCTCMTSWGRSERPDCRRRTEPGGPGRRHRAPRAETPGWDPQTKGKRASHTASFQPPAYSRSWTRLPSQTPPAAARPVHRQRPHRTATGLRDRAYRHRHRWSPGRSRFLVGIVAVATHGPAGRAGHVERLRGRVHPPHPSTRRFSVPGGRPEMCLQGAVHPTAAPQIYSPGQEQSVETAPSQPEVVHAKFAASPAHHELPPAYTSPG